MENLLADLRHAFRVFRTSPGFTAITIAALALGIGANTAIFSVINVVLLKPLPYPEPDRIMAVVRGFPDFQGIGNSTSIPKFNAWKKNDVFEAMAAYDFIGPGMNVGGSDHPEQVKGIHVSSEFFRVFGVSPALGRTFTADEDIPNGPKVAVISYQLFSRRLGSDLRLVGTPIQIGGEPTTVVGVLPATFKSDPPADIFTMRLHPGAAETPIQSFHPATARRCSTPRLSTPPPSPSGDVQPDRKSTRLN